MPCLHVQSGVSAAHPEVVVVSVLLLLSSSRNRV